MNESAAIDQFRDALSAHGIVPPPHLLPDGQLHRCDSVGKPGRKDAAYVLHLDGLPAGGFENHRDGQGWQNWHANTGRTLTDAEREQCRARRDAIQTQRAAAQQAKEQRARETARALWNAAHACTQHPYLTARGISAHGTRTLPAAAARTIGLNVPADPSGDLLLVPVHGTDGDLRGLQWLDGTGNKRFLPGTRKQGGYFRIGEDAPDSIVCIAEGFATAASIHEATGHPAAVAFDAGNLPHVARALRETVPDAGIVICADDDRSTDNNPGLTKAREAASAVNGILAVPDFGGEPPEGASDFNDLARLHGSAAVARCIAAAVEGHASGDDASTGQPPAAVPGEPSTCHYAGGTFELTPRGVLFHGKDPDGQPKPPLWICSPLRIEAKTRTTGSDQWGRLLTWEDDDGVSHQWAMPASMLQGDGLDMRRELADQGLSIAPGRAGRDLLSVYLQASPVAARARCVDVSGWHDGIYVTAQGVIGTHADRVVFQNAQAIAPALSSKNGIRHWRSLVAGYAAGNTRLVFAIGVALAAPLVELAGADSGGFHLRGASSTGKSTALKVAASVWGEPTRYCREWRATANGLEGLAALHNDGLLVLDELSQIDPKQAGEAAYLLANGQGKTRASRNGTARHAARWRLLFLSAGEQSLSDLMAQAGKRTNTGQDIRLADIAADAGAGMGLFEALNGCENAAGLANALREETARHYGAVGVEWLRRIVADRATLPGQLAERIEGFLAGLNLPGQTQGQVYRVARRFALVAAAGELATGHGLTGWEEGEATRAASACFGAWLDGFGGTGNREQRALLEHIRAFFEAHGQSRFQHVNASPDQRIVNRVGFCRDDATHGRQYLVLPEAFKRELCSGFDPRFAARALLDAGWITPDGTGKAAQSIRIPEHGLTRCYVFDARNLHEQ